MGSKGDESVSIKGLTELTPRQKLEIEITSAEGNVTKVPVDSRIQTADEIEYYKNGGILHYVLRQLAVA